MISGFSSLVVASSLLTAVPGASDGSAPELRVTGGQEAKECGIPGVLSLETMANGVSSPSLCTGTLIHPKVILYAGHCGTIHSMTPGERWQQEKMTKDAFEMSLPHPAGNTGAGSPNSAMDWAFAVLKEPLKGVPIIPIAYGCELEMLIGQGKPVTFAGYADNAVGQQSDKIKDYYLKWANTKINAVTDTTLKTTSGAGKVTACRGDSGGPMLARTKDGSWRTIGIASSLGPSASSACGTAQGFNTYAKVRKELVAWIEKESKIDVTPCFDLDGKPTPSLACDRFMAFAEDLGSPKAKWDNNCADAKQLPQKDACGIEDSGEEEPEPETTTGSDDEETTTGSDDEETTTEGGATTDGEGDSGDSEDDQTPDDTPEQTPSPEPTPDDEPTDKTPESKKPSPEASPETSESTGTSGDGDDPTAANQAPSQNGGCNQGSREGGSPLALGGLTLLGLWIRRRRG